MRSSIVKEKRIRLRKRRKSGVFLSGLIDGGGETLSGRGSALPALLLLKPDVQERKIALAARHDAHKLALIGVVGFSLTEPGGRSQVSISCRNL